MDGNLVHENPNFTNFIRGLLDKAELSEKYVNLLTDKKSMSEFTRAFTHKSINPIHNYEYYEILGDSTANKVTVWYYHRRLPQLFDNPGEGDMGPVAIMARLKMVGVSKETFASFADELGFWEYARVSEEDEKLKRTRILEDTFEAFIGCLEYLIDIKVADYSGYSIAYIFMSKLMDKVKLPLTREELYDPKSLLNMDINSFKKVLTMRYETNDKPIDTDDFRKKFESRVIITDIRSNKKYRSAIGYGANKKEAEQAAAKLTRDSGIFTKIPRP